MNPDVSNLDIKNTSPEKEDSPSDMSFNSDSEFDPIHEKASDSDDLKSIDSVTYLIKQEKITEERNYLLCHITNEWQADINENGKTLALYDKAQQKRNKLYTYKKNKKEIMYVYSIVFGRKHLENEGNILDCKKLLNDNEVLSFCFDDFNKSFSVINVQAKNLYIYAIDFTTQTVIRRIPDSTSQIMKGIFYDHRIKES